MSPEHSFGKKDAAQWALKIERNIYRSIDPKSSDPLLPSNLNHYIQTIT